MGAKKWAMIQVWRFQQIAMIGSLLLLILNLSFTIYSYLGWRIRNPYIGVTVVATSLVLIIWFAAWLWDRRFRLWREQQAVLVDRNPYAAERLSAKEIVNFDWIWIPALQKIDPETAAKLRLWVETEYRDYPALRDTVATVKKRILRGRTP
jgi:hypothetical protein